MTARPMTARPIVTAVIAFVAFTGTTAARTVTSQARGQTSADRQGGRQQVTSRGVTSGEGADRTAPKKKTPSQKRELTTKAARLAFIRNGAQNGKVEAAVIASRLPRPERDGEPEL
jgi:Ni/Co efflux regulator RcnB